MENKELGRDETYTGRSWLRGLGALGARIPKGSQRRGSPPPLLTGSAPYFYTTGHLQLDYLYLVPSRGTRDPYHMDIVLKI